MLVRPLSTVDNTRDYARVSHSRQWSNYNVTTAIGLLNRHNEIFSCNDLGNSILNQSHVG